MPSATTALEVMMPPQFVVPCLVESPIGSANLKFAFSFVLAILVILAIPFSLHASLPHLGMGCLYGDAAVFVVRMFISGACGGGWGQRGAASSEFWSHWRSNPHPPILLRTRGGQPSFVPVSQPVLDLTARKITNHWSARLKPFHSSSGC